MGNAVRFHSIVLNVDNYYTGVMYAVSGCGVIACLVIMRNTQGWKNY